MTTLRTHLPLALLAACGPAEPLPGAVVCPTAAPPPSLQWNAFMGTSATHYGLGVATDSAGAVYPCGMSIETWGSPVRPFGEGNWDGFVAKFDADGGLLWNTFLGQTDVAGDYCQADAVDADGSVVVAGHSSDTWETPLRPFSGGVYDGFIARLDPGGALVWNTFVGGPGQDEIDEVALDAAGGIYFTGVSTESWGGPRRAFTGGAFDVSVAKLNRDGTLRWNTFLGGAGEDRGQGLAVSADGTVYVSGWSSQTWGTPLAPFSAGLDVFVAALDADGNLVWSTFLGGAGDDDNRALARSADGSLVVVGYSGAAWGAPLRPFAGGPAAAFVAGLTADGQLVWSTFLGGSGEDIADDVAVDENGDVLVSGFSRATWGAPARPFSGGLSDAFVARLSAGGALVWNLFLGSPGGTGPDDDYGNAIATPRAGTLFVVGDSDATWGVPTQPFSAGAHEAFVARVDDPSACRLEPPRTLSLGCSSQSGEGPLALAWLLYAGRASRRCRGAGRSHRCARPAGGRSPAP